MATKKEYAGKCVISFDLNVTGVGYNVKLTDNDDVLIKYTHKAFIGVNGGDSSVSKYMKGTSFETKASIRRGFRGIRVLYRHKRQIKKRLLNFMENTLNLKYDSEYQPVDMLNLKITALTNRVDEQDLAAILYNYATSRGYFELDDEIKVSSKAEEKEKEDYKSGINNLKTKVEQSGLTISEYKKQNGILAHDKANIVLSNLHRVELEKIWNCQKKYYPTLTSKNLDKIMRNIYFRFNPKSYRKLIGECELETYESDGVVYGKKVTKKSQPSYEEFISWSIIHNIVLKVNGSNLALSDVEKKSIFDKLCKTKKEITQSDLYEHLFDMWYMVDNAGIVDKRDGVVYPYGTIGLDKKDFKIGSKNKTNAVEQFFQQLGISLNIKSIKGMPFTNSVVSLLNKYGVNIDDIPLNGVHYPDAVYYNSQLRKLLYDVYFILNSSTFASKIKDGLRKIFDNEDLCRELSKLSFVEDRGNLSLKAVNKMVVHMNGDLAMLSAYDAKVVVYGKETSTEKVDVDTEIKRLTNSDVRNPLVMNVNNTAIDIINSAIASIPNIDDYELVFKIEMARELCADKMTRSRMDKNQQSNRIRNQFYTSVLSELGVSEKRNNVDKVRMFIEQIDDKAVKNIKFDSTNKNDIKQKEDFKKDLLAGLYKCSIVYNDNKFTIRDIFEPNIIQIEHTIPRTKYNSNDFTNLTICDVATNELKGNMTAKDFIDSLPKFEQDKIYERIDRLYSRNQQKRKMFFVSENEIADLEQTSNQLTLTSYMAKLLSDTIAKYKPNCKIFMSNGSITNMLKDDLGINKFFKDYIFDDIKKEYAFKPTVKFNYNSIERSLNKRLDNRHHVLDSLIVSVVDSKVLHYANNRNKDNALDDLRRNAIIRNVYKQFGLVAEDAIITKNDHDRYNKLLHDKLKSLLDSAVINVCSGTPNLVFTKNGCDGVSSSIHESTYYGMATKSIKYKGHVIVPTKSPNEQNVNTIRCPFESIYTTDTVNAKVVEKKYRHQDGNEYSYVNKSKLKELKMSMTFDFKDNENFMYQGHPYNINDFFEQATLDGEVVYLDKRFKAYFHYTSNATEGVAVANKGIGVKNIKFAYIMQSEEIRRGVYACCSTKSHMNIWVDGGVYSANVVSLNTMLKTRKKPTATTGEKTPFMTITQKQYYFVGLTKSDIVQKHENGDYSYLNNLFYVNGFSEDCITMLKHNQSNVFTADSNFILPHNENATNAKGVKKTTGSPLSNLSKITLNDKNIKVLKCLTLAKIDILGNLIFDDLVTYEFV